MKKKIIYEFKASTNIWTGSVDRQGDKLITTGVLGSIRWWFEVLVRGIGGSACNPNSTNSTKCNGEKHCVVCELFGCTGWARKFKFEVTDNNQQTKTSQIKKNEVFNMCFTELRPINNEWALLEATLSLISKYGAIGGKTVFKPSDENNRQDAIHHKDYGLIDITTPSKFNNIELGNLKSYITDSRWNKVEHNGFSWASLKNMWFVEGKYLTRQNKEQSEFNRVIGRPEYKQKASENDSWLAGRKATQGKAESKKVFSFKNPPRTFGFINSEEHITFDTIEEKLKEVWGKNYWSMLKGDEIIKKLLEKSI
ncbi:MAG: type III-B CRISPR module RAMP protein Cmr1 [Candidatus Magnetoovum sp. WYHC-5]|nr:type III-B CRISPR module RAMP protein Cmr1 [Candidatus Magnetoovum sp. WYHC-5]